MLIDRVVFVAVGSWLRSVSHDTCEAGNFADRLHVAHCCRNFDTDRECASECLCFCCLVEPVHLGPVGPLCVKLRSTLSEVGVSSLSFATEAFRRFSPSLAIRVSACCSVQSFVCLKSFCSCSEGLYGASHCVVYFAGHAMLLL